MAVVIVTGASRGIGQATATHLARIGHTVVATMRDPTLGADLNGHGLTVARLDVTDETSVTELVDRVLGDHGRVDALVNHAAMVDFSPIEHAPLYIDGRRRLSDETWIGLGRRLSDEDFFAEFATLFAPAPA